MGILRNKRQSYTPEEKITILKRHLIGHENVSDICEQLSLHPNQFYKWQSELFSEGSVVFVRKSSPHKVSHELKRFEEEKARFTRTIDNKDKVIAEITEDYVRLKKKIWDPLAESGLIQI